MRWRKLGRVYCPAGEAEWAQTHAFIPTPRLLDRERIRVYAAFLDRGRVGRVGFVELDARDPRRVLRVSERPALDVGEPGAFDDNGVNPLCVVDDGAGRLRMYYVGWQLGVKVPYYLLVGMAVSDDGGETFTRPSRVPALERSDEGLFVRSASCVMRDGGRWKMWYVAGDRWIEVRGRRVPTYEMRYLESEDGAAWGPRGEVCMELAGGGDEFGFGRPFVLKEGGRFRMWYSIRTVSKRYRIGYADSDDGRAWRRRDDEAGIDVSPDGWDSEMICCSAVLPTAHGTYMFYNGNNHGETGFGAAVLEG